jgi:hypothetical protein
MRIEYKLQLDQVSMPYFSMETSEGMHKLFTLAATVMNLLENKEAVCISIHGGNAEDPARKAAYLEQIIESGRQRDRRYALERTSAGRVDSTHHLWVVIRRA